MRNNVKFVNQKIVDFRSNCRKNRRILHSRVDVLLSTVFSVFSVRLIHVLSIFYQGLSTGSFYRNTLILLNFLRKVLQISGLSIHSIYGDGGLEGISSGFSTIPRGSGDNRILNND